MPYETKISSRDTTVIPAYIRKRINIGPGDILIWDIEGSEIHLRVKRENGIRDIAGIIGYGGDAVEAKKRAQRGSI